MKTKHIYLVQIMTCIDPYTGKKVKWYHSEFRPIRATSCADAKKNVFVGATEKIGKVYKYMKAQFCRNPFYGESKTNPFSMWDDDNCELISTIKYDGFVLCPKCLKEYKKGVRESHGIGILCPDNTKISEKLVRNRK